MDLTFGPADLWLLLRSVKSKLEQVALQGLYNQ